MSSTVSLVLNFGCLMSHLVLLCCSRLCLCLGGRSSTTGTSVHYIQLLCISFKCVRICHQGALAENCLSFDRLFVTNVFQLQTLIPVANVKKVTKEKTAKFIPNALGITTLTEKHLFSSLMSRDVTYRLAMSVWKKFHFPNQMEDHDCGEGERVIFEYIIHAGQH